MFLSILSILLLLDVSVSSSSNSSIVQQEDPVVFVLHLNDSLSSENSSLTVDEGKLVRYDKSEQDNTDTDETDGERVIAFNVKNPFSSNSYSKLRDAAAESINSFQSELYKPLLNEQSRSSPSKKLYDILARLYKCFVSHDEETKSYLDGSISNLHEHPATSMVTQKPWFESRLSKLFNDLMLHTKYGSLEEFFRRDLHITFLDQVIKLIDMEGLSIGRTGVAEEIVRLFTASRNGGNLITWLGKIDDHSNQTIESFIKSLLKSIETSKLAYRLLSMRSNDFDDLYKILRGSNSNPDLPSIRSHLIQYATYIRFNFIEHESKSSISVVPNVYSFLSTRCEETEEWQRQLFSKRLELASSFKVDPKSIFAGFHWSDFSEDQVRLFKAALQSNDDAKLVREALQANRQVASFADKLGKETVVDTYKVMLNNEKLVQGLQAVFKDDEAVQMVNVILKDVNGLRDLSSRLTKRGGKKNLKNDQVVNQLKKLIKDENTLRVLKVSMVDADSMMMFKDALESKGRLKLVDDMLSNTELDSATILKVILNDDDKVQFLKEAVKDDSRVELFRSALEDTIGVKIFKTVLVAIKDKNRAKLFRAALKDKKGVKNFLKALNEKKLANVFRAILNENKQLEWLERAVKNGRYGKIASDLDRRDKTMLAAEMINYLDSLPKEQG
ncbi:hypothetical protein Plhal703r1_c01g0005581 [Plasmopara halstedii]